MGIDTIQNAKKTWTKNFVQNEDFRTALDSYVETQREFVKAAWKAADLFGKEVSKELGKFPKKNVRKEESNA